MKNWEIDRHERSISISNIENRSLKGYNIEEIQLKAYRKGKDVGRTNWQKNKLDSMIRYKHIVSVSKYASLVNLTFMFGSYLISKLGISTHSVS